LVAFCAAAIPLLYADGLDGFAIGVGIMTAVALSARAFFLFRLFPGFPIASHTLRAIAPVVPAVAAVLLERALGPSGRTGVTVAVELATYIVVTLIATASLERNLLREALSYLRRVPAPTA
jgi:UDP-N-acetylmuramyl pentapeptide phosphotransferase/UDP-N-acetylglucosamine-1-phosphate transferase